MHVHANRISAGCAVCRCSHHAHNALKFSTRAAYSQQRMQQAEAGPVYGHELDAMLHAGKTMQRSSYTHNP